VWGGLWKSNDYRTIRVKRSVKWTYARLTGGDLQGEGGARKRSPMDCVRSVGRTWSGKWTSGGGTVRCWGGDHDGFQRRAPEKGGIGGST